MVVDAGYFTDNLAMVDGGDVAGATSPSVTAAKHLQWPVQDLIIL